MSGSESGWSVRRWTMRSVGACWSIHGIVRWLLVSHRVPPCPGITPKPATPPSFSLQISLTLGNSDLRPARGPLPRRTHLLLQHLRVLRPRRVRRGRVQGPV